MYTLSATESLPILNAQVSVKAIYRIVTLARLQAGIAGFVPFLLALVLGLCSFHMHLNQGVSEGI